MTTPDAHFVRITNGSTRVILSTPSREQALRLAAAVDAAGVMTIEVENLGAAAIQRAARVAALLIKRAKKAA